MALKQKSVRRYLKQFRTSSLRAQKDMYKNSFKNYLSLKKGKNDHEDYENLIF